MAEPMSDEGPRADSRPIADPPVRCSAMTDDGVLDRYLTAVGLERAAPTMTLLEQLTRRHVARFPFASIGPQLGEPLPLDVDALFDRIVARRRGGYCFEQNGLMFEILGRLGYDTTMVLARVLLSGEEHPPLTHRCAIVELDGRRYLVDVGFGAQGPTTPVLFDPSAPADGRYRIVEREPGEFHLQLAGDDGYTSLYRFDLVRYGASDAEVGHFYSHRHPDATFVNHLVASRVLDDEVRSLRNLELWVVRAGEDERIPIVDAAHLRAVLAEMFDLDVDEDEAERLYAAAAARTRPT